MKNDKSEEINEFLNEITKGLGMDKLPTPAVVALNDIRLRKLCEYEITKGYTNLDITPEVLQEQFKYFKAKVKSKSFTLDELEDVVYSKWGIVDNKLNNKYKETIISGFSDITFAKLSEDDPNNT